LHSVVWLTVWANPWRTVKVATIAAGNFHEVAFINATHGLGIAYLYRGTHKLICAMRIVTHITYRNV
jgi:hypothetical protein